MAHFSFLQEEKNDKKNPTKKHYDPFDIKVQPNGNKMHQKKYLNTKTQLKWPRSKVSCIRQ